MIQVIRTAEKRQRLWPCALRLLADGTHLHVEGACALCQSLADVAVSEDAKRPAGELLPQRRRGNANGPLALPFPVAELAVETPEGSCQRQHGADHVLGDAG